MPLLQNTSFVSKIKFWALQRKFPSLYVLTSWQWSLSKHTKCSKIFFWHGFQITFWQDVLNLFANLQAYVLGGFKFIWKVKTAKSLNLTFTVKKCSVWMLPSHFTWSRCIIPCHWDMFKYQLLSLVFCKSYSIKGKYCINIISTFHRQKLVFIIIKLFSTPWFHQ